MQKKELHNPRFGWVSGVTLTGSGGANGSYARGESRQAAGLADYVSGGTVRLNLGDGFCAGGRMNLRRR